MRILTFCAHVQSDHRSPGGILQTFGGWDRLVTIWRQTFETARRQKRHRRVYQMLNSLWKLQLVAERLQAETARIRVGNWAFCETVAQYPEQAATMLRALGWAVESPSAGSRAEPHH